MGPVRRCIFQKISRRAGQKNARGQKRKDQAGGNTFWDMSENVGVLPGGVFSRKFPEGLARSSPGAQRGKNRQVEKHFRKFPENAGVIPGVYFPENSRRIQKTPARGGK